MTNQIIMLKILSIGILSKNITDEINKCTSKHFENKEDAVEYIKTNISKDSEIFLKASRSMKFEQIIILLEGKNNE